MTDLPQGAQEKAMGNDYVQKITTRRALYIVVSHLFFPTY